VIKIPIGDWFLARSEAFKLLMMKFRDHKINTKEAFSKVKMRHNYFDQELKEQKSRIQELERILSGLREVPIRIKKKKQELDDIK